MWSQGALVFKWPISTRFALRSSVMIKKADRHSPPSGGSGMPKDLVSICLLNRQNLLSVTFNHFKVGELAVHDGSVLANGFCLLDVSEDCGAQSSFDDPVSLQFLYRSSLELVKGSWIAGAWF